MPGSNEICPLYKTLKPRLVRRPWQIFGFVQVHWRTAVGYWHFSRIRVWQLLLNQIFVLLFFFHYLLVDFDIEIGEEFIFYFNFGRRFRRFAFSVRCSLLHELFTGNLQLRRGNIDIVKSVLFLIWFGGILWRLGGVLLFFLPLIKYFRLLFYFLLFFICQLLLFVNFLFLGFGRFGLWLFHSNFWG